MIVIYINGEGTAEKLSPQHVYQGSNQTGVTVFAPVPTTTAMGIAFKLPDGTSTPYYPMTFIQSVERLSQYEFTLPTSITQLAGQASIALQAIYSDGQQTSQLIEFEIEPSVIPDLPGEIDQSAYDIIMQRLQEDRADITTLQEQIGNIEKLSEQAQKASANAVETANQAKETADSLADSIAQANTTAQQAVDIADGAVKNIAQYKGETDSNIAQFKQDVNEEITQFENATDSKIEDFQNTVNGQVANIEATANGAVATANEAKVTADSLADSIAQANTTASEAKEIAKEALEQSKVTGTKVNVDGAFQSDLNFDSDPQTQLNDLKSADTALQNGKVNKSGDTMTGDLTVPTLISDGIKQGNTSKDYLDLIDGKGNNFGLGGVAGKIYRLQQMLRVDPAQLSPTAANGWTVGSVNLGFSEEGIYMVSINGITPFIIIISTAILEGNTNAFFAAGYNISSGMFGRVLYVLGSWVWSASRSKDNTTIDITSVAYKKIA